MKYVAAVAGLALCGVAGGLLGVASTNWLVRFATRRQ